MAGREDRIDSLIAEDKVTAEFRRVYEWQGKILSMLITINDAAKNMRFGASFKDSLNAYKDAASGLQELNKAKAEAIAAESALKQALMESKVTQQGYREQLEAIRLAEARAREEKKKAKDAIVAEKGSIIDLRNELRRLQAQWDAYGPAARKANKQVEDALKRTQAELKKLEADTGRFQRNVGNYPQLVGGLTGLLGSFGLTVGAGAIGKEVFDITLKLDSLNAALKVVSGSEREYAVNQQFLIDTSDRLGLNILDLTKAYKLFYASSTQAGLSANETRKIFNSVSEVSANLKLSQEDTNGVLLAFSQILGKGKVQAEELRGQIGERVPGAFAIAARAIGVTGQELNKMLEKGQVIAADFLPKFAAELEKTFGIDNSQRVEGLQASVNRLSNTFTDLIRNNESGLSRFFTGVIDLATKALEKIDALVITLRKTGAGFSLLANGFNKDAEPLDLRIDREVKVQEELVKSRKLSVSEILALSNDITKQMEAQNKRIQGLIQTYKLPGTGQLPNGEFILEKKGTEVINSVRNEIKILEARRNALRGLIDKQLPATPEEASTAAAAKEPTKAEINAAARLREAQLKAELEIRKIDLQTAIDSQKDIVDNEKASFADRMAAAENYYNLKNILAKEDATTQKKVLDEEIKLGKAVAEQKTAVDKKYEGERVKNTRELGKLITDILKDNASQEIKDILSAAEKRQAAIAEAEDAELFRITELYSQGIISRDQFEAAQLQIQNKYANESLNAEIEYVQKLIDLRKLAGQSTEEDEKKLNDIRNKLRDENLKYAEEAEKAKTDALKKELKTREDYEKEYASRVKELRNELVNAAFSIFGAQFELEKNRLQDQIDLINQRKEADINAIQASSDSEEEKAHKIAVLNAQTDAQKQALERRQRQVDQQKARFDRAKSVVDIVSNTAAGVIKAFRDYPFYLAAPLAGVIGAIGAAQLATVLAQPIPKYKDGREGGPSEWAITGDGGVHEVIESPTGKTWITPDRDTLTYLPANYKVHPSVDDYLSAAGQGAFKSLPLVDGTMTSVDKLTDTVIGEFRKHTDQVVQGLERHKSIMIVKNTHLGIRASAIKANRRIDFLNREIFH